MNIADMAGAFFLGAIAGFAALFGLMYAPLQAKMKEHEQRFQVYGKMRQEAERLIQELSAWPMLEQLAPPVKLTVASRSWLQAITRGLSQWLESQRKRVVMLRQSWEVLTVSYDRWASLPLPTPPESLAHLGERLKTVKNLDAMSWPQRPQLPDFLEHLAQLPLAWDNLRDLLQESNKRVKRVGENTQNIASLRENLLGWHQKLQILSFNLALEANKNKSPAVLAVAQELESLWQQLDSWQQQFQEHFELLREDATAAGGVLEKTTQSLLNGHKQASDVNRLGMTANKVWEDGATQWHEEQANFHQQRQSQADLLRLLQQENVALGEWYESYQRYNTLMTDMRERHQSFAAVLKRQLGE